MRRRWRYHCSSSTGTRPFLTPHGIRYPRRAPRDTQLPRYGHVMSDHVRVIRAALHRVEMFLDPLWDTSSGKRAPAARPRRKRLLGPSTTRLGRGIGCTVVITAFVKPIRRPMTAQPCSTSQPLVAGTVLLYEWPKDGVRPAC